MFHVRINGAVAILERLVFHCFNIFLLWNFFYKSSDVAKCVNAVYRQRLHCLSARGLFGEWFNLLISVKKLPIWNNGVLVYFKILLLWLHIFLPVSIQLFKTAWKSPFGIDIGSHACPPFNREFNFRKSRKAPNPGCKSELTV